jgi:hypothetical protein
MTPFLPPSATSLFAYVLIVHRTSPVVHRPHASQGGASTQDYRVLPRPATHGHRQSSNHMGDRSRKGVDHRTLAGRVSGQSQPHRIAHKHLQSLAPVVEASLILSGSDRRYSKTSGCRCFRHDHRPPLAGFPVSYIARCARLGNPDPYGDPGHCNQNKRNRLLVGPRLPIKITSIVKNWPAPLRKLGCSDSGWILILSGDPQTQSYSGPNIDVTAHACGPPTDAALSKARHRLRHGLPPPSGS